MASGFPPTNAKSGKPVTEKKKRKRPSKKVPTTVLESSSTNFMNLVQKLTGSAGELASSPAEAEDKQPKSDQASPASPVPEPSTYFQNYLHNAMYSDNDSSSSSQQGSQQGALASAALQFPPFLTTMDPASGYNFSAEALEDELYQSGYTGGPSNSYSRAADTDASLFSSSWRDPPSHSEYWYNQMDAMRA